MAALSHRPTILICSLATLLLWSTGWMIIARSDASGKTSMFSFSSEVSKSQNGDAPPRPNRPPPKSITPSQSLTAPEYKRLYQEARAKEAASHPELKKILELYQLHSRDNAKLDAAIGAIAVWLRTPTDPAGKAARAPILQGVQTYSHCLALTDQWRDDELRAALQPDEKFAMQRFAKNLVGLSIDPTPLLGDTGTARAAMDSVEIQLQEKFADFIAPANPPPQLFNQATLNLMRESSIADALDAKTYHLVSPATRQLADYEYQMRTRGRLGEIEH